MYQLYFLLVLLPAIAIFIMVQNRAKMKRDLGSLSVYVPEGMTMDGASIQDALSKWGVSLVAEREDADMVIEYVAGGNTGEKDHLGIRSWAGRLLVKVAFGDRKNYRVKKIAHLLYRATIIAEFMPWQVYHRISDISLSFFANRTKCLIVDLDNTLTEKDKPIADDGILRWLVRLREECPKLSIVIVSNLVVKSARRLSRLKAAAEKIGAAYVAAYGRQVKPNVWPYLQALKIADCIGSEAVMIGDQLFTDIKGANRCGIRAILVDPLGKDAWYTAWKRVPEKIIRRRLKF